MKHHTLPVSPETVHWGYFSKQVAPSLTVRSGDRVTIETLTHHANDDHEVLKELNPAGKLVQVSEIVDALLYLQSAPMVNGENIRIDGGAHAGAKW